MEVRYPDLLLARTWGWNLHIWGFRIPLKWQWRQVHQNTFPKPTPIGWGSAWDFSPGYSGTKWPGRMHEQNSLHPCKHHAGGVQTAQVILGWCHGHCCLCYFLKPCKWNKWEDTSWGTFQQVCWSHHLPEFWMPSLCPSPKGQAVRKVPPTCTEKHHDWLHTRSACL